MIDKDEPKYKLYKKRVKLAKILTIVGCVILFACDVILASGIKGYNGGYFFIVLLGVVAYFFIPLYASWKYDQTPERFKSLKFYKALIALFILLFVGNIALHFFGVL